MRSWLAIVVVALALVPGLGAAEVWVPLAGEAGDTVRVDLVRSTEEGLELEVALPGVSLAAVETEGLAFTALEIAGLGRTGQPGEPELPALSRFVEVPIGATVVVEAQVLDRVTVDLAARGLSPALYPAQLPRPKCDCEEARNWRFSHDPKAYLGVVERETASLRGPFSMRDHSLMQLTVSPVRYDAVAGTLEVARRIRVRVDFSGGDVAATAARKQRLASRHFDAILDRGTVNLNFGGEAAGWHYPADAPVEFLVVAPNDAAMLTALEPFVAWKTSTGFNVRVVTTAVTGTTTSAIKSYIQGLYNSADPPVYILMIGDSPTPLVTYTVSGGGSGGTDLPYVQMDADLYPDMIIARWPVDDAAELIAMRDKILHYQQPTADNSAWLNRALFLGGDDYPSHGMTTHQDVMALLMQPPPNSAECEYWNGETQNPTTAQLIADLNTGRGWAVYSAHSGPDGWSGDPPFSSSNVAQLNNLGMYPLGVGHSCSSNEWNAYPDVFGEVTVTTADKGFVSYWGGSASTYWDEDDWLERGFFDSMFDQEMPGTILTLDRQYSQGAACYSGLTEVTLHGGNESYYWHCYNLDGDPTLDPFTKRPVGMTIGVDPVMPPAATDTFTVTVSDSVGAVAGALVAASQNGVLLGAGFSDATGTAVFHVDAPQAGTDVLVRVTAHNHLPTDASVMAGAGSDGVVVLDRSLYRCDSVVTIEVFDEDLAGQGTITVNLAAAPSGGGTTVQLAEQGGGVVRFRGTATLGVNLAVAHGDTLTVTYHDQNTGGGSGADKYDTAVLDCAGPVISGLAADNVGATSAVVTWTTDEPGTSEAVASPGGVTASDGSLVTSHALLLEGLEQCTNYSVTVSSLDALGNPGTGGPVTFQTLQQTVALDDDVESGNVGWTVQSTIPGGTNWSIVVDGSPNHSWFSSDAGAVKDDRLIAGPFTLGGGTTTLSFDHHFGFESGWDGGVIEVSTDGASWQDVTVAGGVFVAGGYSGSLYSYNSSNPLGANRPVWTGSGSGAVEVDLSALAGGSLWFRFRLGCDSSVSADGWYVDNILLETTSACVGVLFADDFESGDCSHWSLEVP